MVTELDSVELSQRECGHRSPRLRTNETSFHSIPNLIMTSFRIHQVHRFLKQINDRHIKHDTVTLLRMLTHEVKCFN